MVTAFKIIQLKGGNVFFSVRWWEWSVRRMNYSICEITSLRYWLQFWITNGDGSEVLLSNVKLSELVWVIGPWGEWGFQPFGFVFLTTDFLPSNIFYEWTTFFNFSFLGGLKSVTFYLQIASVSWPYISFCLQLMSILTLLGACTEEVSPTSSRC
jgi:hypothetical protein